MNFLGLGDRASTTAFTASANHAWIPCCERFHLMRWRTFRATLRSDRSAGGLKNFYRFSLICSSAIVSPPLSAKVTVWKTGSRRTAYPSYRARGAFAMYSG